MRFVTQRELDAALVDMQRDLDDDEEVQAHLRGFADMFGFDEDGADIVLLDEEDNR